MHDPTPDTVAPDRALVIALAGFSPRVDDDAWIAPNAAIVGDVTVAADASVWYGTVLRAEDEPISIGSRTNLQDGVVGHVDPGHPLTVGADVSVGHRAVLHGCTIDDECLIGMAATVLSGAVIGRGSLVAAGAVVLGGMVVPPGSLVAGVPAKVRRDLTEEEREDIRRSARTYLRHRDTHRSALS